MRGIITDSEASRPAGQSHLLLSLAAKTKARQIIGGAFLSTVQYSTVQCWQKVFVHIEIYYVLNWAKNVTWIWTCRASTGDTLKRTDYEENIPWTKSLMRSDI